MTPPSIENSTKEERLTYVLEAWKCLHDCEACGKCRILKGRDATTLYADYINGTRSYMEITFEIRERNYWMHSTLSHTQEQATRHPRAGICRCVPQPRNVHQCRGAHYVNDIKSRAAFRTPNPTVHTYWRNLLCIVNEKGEIRIVNRKKNRNQWTTTALLWHSITWKK